MMLKTRHWSGLAADFSSPENSSDQLSRFIDPDSGQPVLDVLVDNRFWRIRIKCGPVNLITKLYGGRFRASTWCVCY